MSNKFDEPPAYGNPQQPPQAYYGGYNHGYNQGPPPQGYYQPQPNMGYYQQQPGPYPQQGGYYPPQGGYYQDQNRGPGFAEALLASLACCCCLDCLLF